MRTHTRNLYQTSTRLTTIWGKLSSKNRKNGCKIGNAQKWAKIKRKNLGRVFHREKEQNVKNKQTNVRKTKLKIVVVLALSGKTKKAYTFPIRKITICVQGIKRKLWAIEEKLRRFAKRVSGERRIRFPFVFLKFVSPSGRVLVSAARQRRRLVSDKHTPNCQISNYLLSMR